MTNGRKYSFVGVITPNPQQIFYLNVWLVVQNIAKNFTKLNYLAMEGKLVAIEVDDDVGRSGSIYYHSSIMCCNANKIIKTKLQQTW